MEIIYRSISVFRFALNAFAAFHVSEKKKRLKRVGFDLRAKNSTAPQ